MVKFRNDQGEDENVVKYSEVRENMASLKSTAGQDVVMFFNNMASKMKAEYNVIVKNSKKTTSP